MYSSVSVLRTIETAFGLPPMTQFDAAALPMSKAFTSAPNLSPYDAMTPQVSLTAKNSADSPLAAQSQAIDFSEPDRIPMRLMNEIVWESVRGRDSRMPVTGSRLPDTDGD